MGCRGFLRESGETLWTMVGSSWFRLMICRASCVFPEDTHHTDSDPIRDAHQSSHSNLSPAVTGCFTVL